MNIPIIDATIPHASTISGNLAASAAVNIVDTPDVSTPTSASRIAAAAESMKDSAKSAAFAA